MKWFKRYKAVAYLPNLYTLLQYLLLEPYKIEDTLFCIRPKLAISVVSRLPEYDLFREDSYCKFLLSVIKVYWIILRNRNLPIYLGGHFVLTDVFLRCSKNPNYLEDGTASYELVYISREKSRRKKFLSRLVLGNMYPCLGLASHVRKIYLTGLLPTPEIIADKVELFNLKQLWLQKTKEQQEEIARIFLPADLDRHAIIKAYDVFLMTQPFSEYSSGSFSEEDKIEVYRRLVSGYDESALVIKVHPIERTDYSKYFPKAHIIDLPCPLELLVLMGLRAKTVISVNSTAILGIDDFQEKIISGYDVTPALKKEAISRGIYKGISNQSVHISNLSDSSKI